MAAANRGLFALVDCNNFYVSCERLFAPGLCGRPVVVLSNNDGCVIARSNEAKALGIAMGEPYFKVAAFLRRHGVRVFSSNYALYGDISQRVMETLAAVEPAVEVYSIDEAFVRLPMMDQGAGEAWAAALRERVERDVGIPVSVGLGTTRTLAKVANRLAKKKKNGVCALVTDEAVTATLAALPVADVWGVGRRTAEKLIRRGAPTALAYRRLPDDWLRRYLHLPGLRTAMELRGISCIPPERASLSGRSVVCSRSFKEPVRDAAWLREAVSAYAALAGEKLRRRGLAAACLHVFLRTSPHRTDQPQYRNQTAVPLAPATAHGRALIRAAIHGLDAIYRPGFDFRKAGVMLTGLVAADAVQGHLFRPGEDDALMAAIDRVNHRYGRDTLRFAATGLERPWAMRREFPSPAYTTRWQDLPVVTA